MFLISRAGFLLPVLSRVTNAAALIAVLPGNLLLARQGRHARSRPQRHGRAGLCCPPSAGGAEHGPVEHFCTHKRQREAACPERDQPAPGQAGASLCWRNEQATSVQGPGNGTARG